MTVAPSDVLLAVLAGFVMLGAIWIVFLAQLLVRVARGGAARGE